MTSDKLILMLLTIAPLTALSSCGCNSEKTKISDTMRGYVEPRLTENETFGFIGISHRRDTLFMDASYPCMGVIYTVTDREPGETDRHFADVIFSNDYETAICVKESGFDPVEYAEGKLKEKLKEKIPMAMCE